ncbi:hypothetical protein KDW_60740 [Dictyobacter vulcani]|uniref:Uncharacterized protein n=1 Tax=Dictyobacter vulcani TaxID=2607529 RepID=A0A5J4KXW6_9CHLR|nr:hypothetical protein [Dictyobacter vulcani]GER91912.1 hypothetical protein KDW_60740 [Dictyobacter vulcani]
MDKPPARKTRKRASIEKILVLTGCIILLFTFWFAVIALLFADYQESPATANHGFGAYWILFVLMIPLLLLAAIGTIILLSGLIVALIKRRRKAANTP